MVYRNNCKRKKIYVMRFHKRLVKKCGARFTVVLQYSLSEQVRNEREPFTTDSHAMWFICKKYVTSPQLQKEKKNRKTIKTVTKL